jgi:hypothetical protein
VSEIESRQSLIKETDIQFHLQPSWTTQVLKENLDES